MIHVNYHPSDRHLRVFAVGQAVFVGLLLLFMHRRGASQEWCYAVIGASALISVVGVSRPQWVRWVYVIWMLAMFPVGWCLSHMLLAAVYCFLVTPLGVLLRCFGHDPIERKFDFKRETYWIRRGPSPAVSRYFRQF